MKNVVGWFRRVVAALTHWVTATQSSNHPTTGRRVEGVRNTEVPQHPVGQVTTIGEQRLGIVDRGTDVSRDLRRLIDKNILTRGEPFQSGGMLGPACLPLLGVGAGVSSSLLAGNIFLATANTVTLMQIGATPAEGPEKCGPRRPPRNGYSCNNAGKRGCPFCGTCGRN